MSADTVRPAGQDDEAARREIVEGLMLLDLEVLRAVAAKTLKLRGEVDGSVFLSVTMLQQKRLLDASGLTPLGRAVHAYLEGRSDGE